jgi:hypothetical protein
MQQFGAVFAHPTLLLPGDSGPDTPYKYVGAKDNPAKGRGTGICTYDICSARMLRLRLGTMALA